MFIFLPFILYLFLSLSGYRIGQIGAVYLIFIVFLVLWGSSLVILNNIVNLNETYYINFGVWFKFDILVVEWEFLYDPLSITILFIVICISFCVHVYSISYIWNDAHFIRFISLLSLFTFFILILISAGNLIQFFIGWEGIGLCSYFLINFWNTRLQANKAALKAILINKIGDLGFLIAIGLIAVFFNTLDFSLINALSTTVYESYLLEANISKLGFNSQIIISDNNVVSTFSNFDAIALMLFIAVCAKSAQFGLHTWLPSAIEGPTPVSALIHAATIVTAGIFLVLKLAIFFSLSTLVLKLFIIVGFVTALTSAITAFFIYDIKRIIAYSTCSQLGYIVIACGFGEFSIGYFHLINHAFFKALLFLTAGIIIHSKNNEQDIRILSVGYSIPILTIMYSISSAALIGLPFFSGFYSKEHLLLLSLLGVNNKIIILVLISLPTIFTTLYSLRVFYYLFNKKLSITVAQPQPVLLNIVLSVLFVISVVAGFFANEIFASPISNFIFWELKMSTNVISIFDTPDISEVILSSSTNNSNNCKCDLQMYNNLLLQTNVQNSHNYTDRSFLVEARNTDSNFLSSSYINRYFNYNPIKFSYSEDNPMIHVSNYTTSYNLLLNYYHNNFVFYCNKIIQAYFPINNILSSSTSFKNAEDTWVYSEDWIRIFLTLNDRLNSIVQNVEWCRFTGFHLITVLFYHIKFNLQFFENLGEQEFYIFLLSPFLNRNAGFGDAIFFYKGLKASFENLFYLKHSINSSQIPTYMYYAYLWKLGVVTGGYHSGAPMWVIWLIKLYYFKSQYVFSLIGNIDILNINYINSTLYSFYYLYILFNNEIVTDVNNTITFINFWSNIIGSNYFKYAETVVNKWFESSTLRASSAILLPIADEVQSGDIYRIGWNMQSPFLKLYFQTLFNTNTVVKNELDWQYSFINGLTNIMHLFLIKASFYKNTQELFSYFNSDINKDLLETLNRDNKAFYAYCEEPIASIINNNYVRQSAIVSKPFEIVSPFEVVDMLVYESINSSTNFGITILQYIESQIPLRWRTDGHSSIENLYNKSWSVFNAVEYFTTFWINFTLYTIIIIIYASKLWHNFYLSNTTNSVINNNTNNLIIPTIYFKKQFTTIASFISKNFLVDNLINYFSHKLIVFAKAIYKAFDKGILELMGPIGINNLFVKAAVRTRMLFSEKLSVQNHLKFFVFNAAIIFIIIIVICFF